MSVRSSSGHYNSTDGSLELPVSNIAAARLVGDDVPTQALQELKSPAEFAGMLDRSGCAALRLIEALGRLYRNQFERKVQRYQDTASNAEAEKLWSEISLELFGA